MRSLFGEPATHMYPDVPREWADVTHGHIEIDIDNCCFCGHCARKCLTYAIDVDREAASWTIKRMRCIQCMHCVEVCPKGCLKNLPTYTPPNTEKVVDVFVKPPAS